MDIDDFDLEHKAQQIALSDTIAWDRIYARACRAAHKTGYAQLILERGPDSYELVDGQSPDALRIERLDGTKIHVILDWAG